MVWVFEKDLYYNFDREFYDFEMFYALVNSVKELNNYIAGIYTQLDVLNHKISGLEQRKDSLKQQNKQLKEQISILDKRLKKLEK